MKIRNGNTYYKTSDFFGPMFFAYFLAFLQKFNNTNIVFRKYNVGEI